MVEALLKNRLQTFKVDFVTRATARTVASVQSAEVSAVPVGSTDGQPDASEVPADLALSPTAFGHAARGGHPRLGE